MRKSLARMLIIFLTVIVAVPALPVSAAEQSSSTAAVHYDHSSDQKIIQKIESLDTDSDGRTISVNVQGMGITTSNVKSVTSGIFNSAPQLFYIYKSYRAYTESGTSNIKKIAFTMNMSVSSAKTMTGKLKQELSRIDKHVSRPRMSDEEIALAVHDYIAANTMYDRSFSGSHINDLYGALVGHKAVCEGYAQAYQYVMQHYGVHTSIVTSDNACHAWNIVKIRGNWYHVDVTWDDPIKGSSATDEPGAVNHNYFLLSTSTLLKKSSSDARRKDFVIEKSGSEKYSSMTSKKFENGFWKKSKSAMWYYGGKWYYSGKDRFEIVRYDYKTKSSKKIIRDSSVKWPVAGKKRTYYAGSYSYLAADGRYLYYTMPTKVCRYDMGTGRKTTNVKCKAASGSVYGVKISNGSLYYVIKKAPYGTRTGSLRKLGLK